MDPNLNHSAQAWADNLLSIRTLKHSNANTGENLYYTYNSSPQRLAGKYCKLVLLLFISLHCLFHVIIFFPTTGDKPVENWYNEIKNYNFQRPGFNSGTGELI